MGHSLLGGLPATRSWKEVVELIATHGDVEDVAGATVRASDQAFAQMEEDRGFREAVWLLTQLAIAAKAPDPAEKYRAIGLELADQTSVIDVALAITRSLDDRIPSRERSAIGEMAQKAIVTAITEHISDRSGPLFTATSDEVHSTLRSLGRQKEFASLSRSFFAKLTQNCLEYFLTKALGAHVGEGRRFTTTAQMTEFRGALETHCRETSLIVETFSGEWFSKNRFTGGGDISFEKTGGLGWKSLQKIRSEMKERAKTDAAHV